MSTLKQVYLELYYMCIQTD